VKVHSRARTTPIQRHLAVERVGSGQWSIREAARRLSTSPNTVRKWLSRARRGEPLTDRSSRRARSPLRISDELKALILSMRRFRLTVTAIAQIVRVPRSSVARLVSKEGLGTLRDVDRKSEPVIRYEAENAGDLVHLDIKKLGRIDGVGHRITGDRSHRSRAGWEYAFVAVDDRSRAAYVELFRSETALSAVQFLRNALAFFRRHAIRVRALLTDNGSAFLSRAFAVDCQRFRVRHKRTRAYRPQTNGKAERFIQTLLREWAYVRAYRSSTERRRALTPFLRHYNHRRPHAGILGASPMSRLVPVVNNLMRNDN
jgi:transposase InsO family protein